MMSNRKEFEQQTDPRIAVVDDICAVEETEKPFGKRWHHEEIVLPEHLAAATYRRLGQPAAYVRQRGFESLQQVQMALQYVEKHGRITRREAAELCQLGPYQATRLLARLVQDGRLVRLGTRRGAYYERRP